MENTSDEIGMLMGCASEKLVICVKLAEYVLPSIASAIAPTNSREDSNEINGRATTSRDIR